MRMTGLGGGIVDVDVGALEAFSARLDGPTLRPGDPRFAATTRIWNGMIERTPALVVQPATPGDVRCKIAPAE